MHLTVTFHQVWVQQFFLRKVWNQAEQVLDLTHLNTNTLHMQGRACKELNCDSYPDNKIEIKMCSNKMGKNNNAVQKWNRLQTLRFLIPRVAI